LGATQLLRGLDVLVLNRIAQQPGAFQRVDAGASIFEMSEEADAIFFPAPLPDSHGPSGLVQLTIHSSETSHRGVDKTIVAGEVFGELEFVGAGLSAESGIRRTSARTLIPCGIFRVPYAMLNTAIVESPALRTRLIRHAMLTLFDALDAEATRASPKDPDRQLAKWLLDLAETAGTKEGGRVTFRRRIKQTEIANALGVSRETTSIRLNEWERAGLIRTGAERIEIVDYPRLALYGSVKDGDIQEAIERALAEIDADLDRNDLVRARNVALDMLSVFPSSPELRYRAALSNMRAGASDAAIHALAAGGLAASGDALRERVRLGLINPSNPISTLLLGMEESDDPDWAHSATVNVKAKVLTSDIAALQARAHKELAFDATDPAKRVHHAATSARLYLLTFEQFRGHYPAINAASMSQVAGDRAGATALARQVAEMDTARSGYWGMASKGEAHLLLGEQEAALAAFKVSRDSHECTDGKIAVTRRQVLRLRSHVEFDGEAVLEQLRTGKVAIFAGPLGIDSDLTALPAEDIRGTIARSLRDLDIRYLYGGLACGADILVAEEAIAAGLEMNVVLPFPAAIFVERSVALSADAKTRDNWVTRFWQCLRQSSSLEVAFDSPPSATTSHSYYVNGFRLAAGKALLRADALLSICILVELGNLKKPRGEVTDSITGLWKRSGGQVVSIGQGESCSTPKIRPRRDPFAPVVFLWPADQSISGDDLTMMIGRAGLQQCSAAIARTTRGKRSGIALPFETMERAQAGLISLAEVSKAKRMQVCIVGDVGPIRDAQGNPDARKIAGLPAAVDLPGLPVAMPLGTPLFAAMMRLLGRPDIRLFPIGRTAEGTGVSEKAVSTRELYAFAIGPHS
jgi:CRP-like cAMP-binding protein